MAQVYQWYQNPENFEEILLEFPELETCSSLRDVLNLKPAIVERAHSYVRKAILRADLGIIQSELAKQEQKEEEAERGAAGMWGVEGCVCLGWVRSRWLV